MEICTTRSRKVRKYIFVTWDCATLSLTISVLLEWEKMPSVFGKIFSSWSETKSTTWKELLSGNISGECEERKFGRDPVRKRNTVEKSIWLKFEINTCKRLNANWILGKRTMQVRNFGRLTQIARFELSRLKIWIHRFFSLSSKLRHARQISCCDRETKGLVLFLISHCFAVWSEKRVTEKSLIYRRFSAKIGSWISSWSSLIRLIFLWTQTWSLWLLN